MSSWAQLCRRTERTDLGGEAGALPGALSYAALDDARLRNQHIHQVPARHQVKQKVQMQLVLRTQGAARLGALVGPGQQQHDVQQTAQVQDDNALQEDTSFAGHSAQLQV